MDVDFSKRLCDATLGEYLAAERTVGILSSWAIAVFMFALGLAAKLGWNRWRAWRAKRAAPNAYYGGRVDFVSAYPAPLVSAWYTGDTFQCRRCAYVDFKAGQLGACPNCGFVGGAL
jgi:hypothetical protein